MRVIFMVEIASQKLTLAGLGVVVVVVVVVVV